MRAAMSGRRRRRAMIEICHVYTCAVMHIVDRNSLVGADLHRVFWREANLHGMDLSKADLRNADLEGAALDGTNLQGAKLQGASLQGARLQAASLQGVNFQWASLDQVGMHGVNLEGAILEDGIRWETYITAVVPALLQAGGRSLAEVLATGCWGCDTWEHGPLAEAFGVHRLEDIPPLYRWQAERFLRFFRAGLLPIPALV
jgi:hypothetical protein